MKAAEKYDLLVLLLPGWNPAHNSEVQSKDEMEGLSMGVHWGPRTENKLNWSELHCVPYLVTYRDLSPRAILVFISSPWPGKAREGNVRVPCFPRDGERAGGTLRLERRN